jgi:hypothetical protein
MITLLNRKASFIEMADILRFSTNITEETLIASIRLLVYALYFMLADFLLTHGRHNQLPPDSPFPQIDILSDGFNELSAIIAKYNTQSHFRLRLLHCHTTIPEGQILLGTSITEPSGFWTRPISISGIDSQKIHPYIISVDTASCTTEDEKRNGLLLPSEFRKGPAVSIGNIDGNFFTEFTNCFWTKGLENTLGLEAIQGQAGKMIEFSFDIGSLLLKEDKVNTEVRGQLILRNTGWAVIVKGEAVDQTREMRYIIYKTRYFKVTNSQLKDISDTVKILRDKGILAIYSK